MRAPLNVIFACLLAIGPATGADQPLLSLPVMAGTSQQSAARDKFAFCFRQEELTGDLQDHLYTINVLARYLQKLGEPAISSTSRTAFVVRLTLMDSFDGAAAVVVSEDASGKVTGHYYRTAAKPRMPAQPAVLAQGNLEVSRETLIVLKRLVADSRYFEQSNRQQVLVVDGSRWVLEVKQGGRCRALYRPIPYGDPVYYIGKTLLDAAGIPLFDR